MGTGMGGKGKKPGGNLEDKLSEALRRAEEAVLRDGKLRDEEEKGKRKPAGKKPLDMDDIIPSPTAKPKPAPPGPKQPPSEVPVISFDQKKKTSAPRHSGPPPAAAPAAPKKAAPREKAKPAAPNLGFGMLDLGGGSADSPQLELATTPPGEKSVEQAAKKPIEKPVEVPAEMPPAQPPSAEPPRVRPAELELPARRKTPEEYVPYVPRRSYAREIKIALLVLLILAVVGGGVYGFLKWRESVDAEKAALREQIDSASRESLMDDTIKKEKFK